MFTEWKPLILCNVPYIRHIMLDYLGCYDKDKIIICSVVRVMDSKFRTLILDDSTKDAVRTQLSRILSSTTFRDSPQARRLLSFVVDAVLSGQTYHIKQYTIAVNAFGYPPDFDPHINPVIRVLAGRLRMILERYYAHEGSRDDIRIEIPKQTYIPVFQTTSVPEEEVSSRFPKSPLPVADYGLSIAVIPFKKQSLDTNNAGADNITEAITMGLAHFHELCVVGPLGEYKDHPVKTDEIGRQYHVRFVLQGRVQSYGNTLRVTANLTDTSTGFKIWSQAYEYTQSDANLLEIEDEVSRKIVSALADYGGIIPCFISQESMKKKPDGLKIHDAICCQNLYMKAFTMQAHQAAVDALEHTLKTDPDNAVVLAMLGNAYFCNNLFDLIPGTATLEKSENLVRQAKVLNPECQMAHLTEAGLRFLQEQPDRCMAELQLVQSLNPFNSYVIHASSVLLCMLGYWEDGMQLWKTAAHLNPSHTPFYYIVPFMNHYRRGDYETAWKYAVRFNTPMFWDPLIRAAAAGQLGLRSQAQIALKELLEMRPDFPMHARDLLHRFVFLEEHSELLLDGLVKAGLKPKSPLRRHSPS